MLYVDQDAGAYTFSVSDEHDPCRPETGEDIPGESVVDEALRRGGFMRNAQELLDELDDAADGGRNRDSGASTAG